MDAVKNPRYIVRYLDNARGGWCVIDTQTHEIVGKHGGDETAAWEDANEQNELDD